MRKQCQYRLYVVPKHRHHIWTPHMVEYHNRIPAFQVGARSTKRARGDSPFQSSIPANNGHLLSGILFSGHLL